MLIQSLDLLRICALFFLLVCAAYTDLRHGKVYNWCTYTCILVGLLVSLAIGGHTAANCPPFHTSIMGLLFGFGLFYLAHLFGGLGVGDAKLMGGVGALMGWHFVIFASFYSALVGAVLAVFVLGFKHKLGEGLKTAGKVFLSPRTMQQKEHVDGTPTLTGITIPFGFATAVGTIFTWFLRVPVS